MRLIYIQTIKNVRKKPRENRRNAVRKLEKGKIRAGLQPGVNYSTEYHLTPYQKRPRPDAEAAGKEDEGANSRQQGSELIRSSSESRRCTRFCFHRRLPESLSTLCRRDSVGAILSMAGTASVESVGEEASASSKPSGPSESILGPCECIYSSTHSLHFSLSSSSSTSEMCLT